VTVGFYSPLPPARTGVADYSNSLLAALRRRGTVAVAPQRCDVPLYHVGNNQLHAAIYDRALVRPGVVVLHDAVLHHFLLGRLDQAPYLDEFAFNYGEWSRGLARELWQARRNSATQPRYFEYPLLKRVAERSLAVIVHNPGAAAAVRRHAPHARVFEVPHLFDAVPLPSAAESMRWRQAHGIAPGAFLFVMFGYLRESKRLFSVLQAFNRVRKDRPEAALLVAGDFVSSDLARAAEPLLRAPAIARAAYLPDRQFWTAAAATDACLNLRYPDAGETSGIAIRLMGIGRPVLLTESAATAAFPDDACIRIPPGLAERDALWHYMLLLTSKSEASRQIGSRGAVYVLQNHSVESVADRYWKILCDCRP